jgi:triphosphoribosyl-dephospho-CoA synthetase
MLEETEGVNTQRGLLFLAGVVCGAAGRCIRLKKIPDRKNIVEECSRICSGIVEKELGSLSRSENTIEERESSGENNCSRIVIWNELTNGEKLYLKYGITGIRGEIEKGLPSVVNTGLPYYDDALKAGLDTASSLAHTLISLMTVVEDTTVVNRCGIDGLKYMRNSANFAIKLGGMKTLDGKEYIINMDRDFIDKKISPGGAADLLAVTVMIKKIEEDFHKQDS